MDWTGTRGDDAGACLGEDPGARIGEMEALVCLPSVVSVGGRILPDPPLPTETVAGVASTERWSSARYSLGVNVEILEMGIVLP